jgi:uncharacterized protein
MPPARSAEFRFSGVLNRFLAPARRDRAVEFAFDGTPAVKDPIEALGVPHTEVSEVRIDGAAVSLAYRLSGGEHVDVHPVFDPAVPRTSVADIGAPAFVLDVHLGRLAGYLRLLGIDAQYDRTAHDDDLLATAMTTERRLLTRDTGLLKRTRRRQGAFVYATDPLRQVREVVERFGLMQRLAPFTRCSHCNLRVERIAAEEARPFVPARVAAHARAFSRCTGCGHVYWDGSHLQKLKERLAGVDIGI